MLANQCVTIQTCELYTDCLHMLTWYVSLTTNATDDFCCRLNQILLLLRCLPDVDVCRKLAMKEGIVYLEEEGKQKSVIDSFLDKTDLNINERSVISHIMSES